MWNSSAGDCCSSKYCSVFTQNWSTCLVGSRIYRGTPVWMWISTSNEYSSSLLELHGEVSDCGRVLSACRYENTGMKIAFQKNKCLYMKCKQIQTRNVDVLYCICICVCKCDVYVTHTVIIEIESFKEQNSALQWYLWIITGGLLGSKLGHTQLDLIKMICLL